MKSFSEYIEKTVEDYYHRFGIIVEGNDKKVKESDKDVDVDDVDSESNQDKLENPKKKVRKRPAPKKRQDMAPKIPKIGK